MEASYEVPLLGLVAVVDLAKLAVHLAAYVGRPHLEEVEEVGLLALEQEEQHHLQKGVEALECPLHH